MHAQTPAASELTSLERSVLEVALNPDVVEHRRLRRQAEVAKVSTRTLSGVGFMTKLEIPAALAVADLPVDAALPVVFGEHPQLPAGAEFVLQLRSGRLNTIEAFCYEGMWPGDESLFRFEVRP